MKVILKRHNTTLFFTYSVILGFICLLMSVKVLAGEPDVEKKKTYSKSYSVSSSDKISFTNQFGELKINTWDKNEVKAEITITASASTDEKAQAILDRISIEDGKGDGGVYFKTKFANENEQKWEKGEKQKFSINYVVYMPSHNPLAAKNSFGPISIGDYSGEATFESKFGSLTAGKLTNTKKVTVEFGKATIASLNSGSLWVKFSKAEVGNLDGNVQANFEFCDGIKLNIDNDTRELNIKNKFSHLYLDVSTNISANFDISTHFGNFKNQTSFDIKEENENDNRRGPHFDKRYSGKAGSGNIAMKIKSEFGEITLGHNLPFDVNKNEKKEKKGQVSI